MTTESERFHTYIPSEGHGLPHDPFNAIIGPRPIGWMSTKSSAGVLNLAPYSFFNAFNYTPPIIGFSSLGKKDTLTNIEETGEFVWNLATYPLAEAMNQSCAAVPFEVNEFELAQLTPLASLKVAPPRVAESPVTMECKCTQIIQLRCADGTNAPSWLVLGEVVAVHIEHRLLKDGIYDTAAGQPILRGGGPADYFKIEEAQRFRMFRPR
ncbi:flavin reductase family protein [Diaphorobacter sp. HDW4B]|uniref:flavin reductase family protein n=1 Tax=Diaphorobacter sp. HDW4B TaxID=2714925 RepID=UPI0014086F93|nr:flavin reductase family protein [Diaphorobacter sp. HDW4B]QIL70904.1 flavin reductase family protein [Diaphorobacter sp. HDW4B]